MLLREIVAVAWFQASAALSGILPIVDWWFVNYILEHSISPVFAGQAAQEEFREHFGAQLHRKWCGRGLKSQKNEDLRVAIYFGNHK